MDNIGSYGVSRKDRKQDPSFELTDEEYDKHPLKDYLNK